MDISTKKQFSLIELLIVIAVLGALVALVLPSLNTTEIQAEEIVVEKEMADVSAMFTHMCGDCVISDSDLTNIAKDGLWALIQRRQPAGCNMESLDEYDYDRGCGWKGPYAQKEGERNIDVSLANGQESAGDVTVPVIHDPYHEKGGSDGHYYRVMIPTAAGNERYIALVCVGSNGMLESVAGENEVVAGGDDTVTRLLPLR